VEVSVPIGQLQWIQIPGFNSSEGSPVRVYHESAWGPDAHREGRVVRLKTNLEPRGRMAQILVRVEDPLALEQPPRDRRALILGSYVRVEVEGRAVTDAVRVPRTALRDGDHVWTMDEDASLRIHRVEIAWSTEEYVLVRDGIASGDLIITSDLGAPVEGMKLRLPGQGPGKRSPDGQGAGGEEAQ
jgi:hypothetical protein